MWICGEEGATSICLSYCSSMFLSLALLIVCELDSPNSIPSPELDPSFSPEPESSPGSDSREPESPRGLVCSDSWGRSIQL